MTHYQNINGRDIKFDCGCSHPGIEGNTCPTRSGDCESCEYGKAELTICDLYYLLDQASGKH